MKIVQPIRFLFMVMLVGFLFTTACNDKWNEHYDEANFDLPDKTIKETIEEKSELSIFSGMLKKTGYDKILDASQAFTVWAPDNDALQGIDTTDMELVMEIVRNHITRNRITTSGVYDESIRMLNGKFLSFTRDAAGFTFAENMVLESNVPATNGLLYIIDGYAPYSYNLWEFLGRTEDLDSLSRYIYGESKKVFDPVNSVEIGVDSAGQIVYDSLFVIYNELLGELGSIDSEDSIYTAVLPNNTAWDEAYGRLVTYFNFPEDGGSALRQREQTQWTIAKDMLYNGYVNPSSNLDSLVSTSGTVYYNPSYIFADTQRDSLSNGLAYVTSQMPYADTDALFREIRIEAEDNEGRINLNNNVFQRTSFGSSLDVSDNRYILVDPTSVNSSVEFPVPNTLSAKYNIYCVFVPASIVDPTNLTPTKVKFELTYIRRESGSTTLTRITPDVNFTSPFGMTKMLVTEFDFEYANVIDEDYPRIAVKIKVINDVSSEEEQAGAYSRTMRIDCIIFEPVTE